MLLKCGVREALRPLLDVIPARSARSPCRDAPAFGGGIRSGGRQPGASKSKSKARPKAGGKSMRQAAGGNRVPMD
jgi:hypothetical protein